MRVTDGQIFQSIGEMWTAWIPEGTTIRVFISPDGKEEHFAEIGEESELSGPNVFQCMGFNNHSFFKITGIGEDNYIDILA